MKTIIIILLALFLTTSLALAQDTLYVYQGGVAIFKHSVNTVDSITFQKQNANTVTDINGNVYNTVKIGSQVWMVENLKVKNYRNGDPIANVTDPVQWSNVSGGAYCSYDNSNSNADVYGYLYNWFAATDKRNIAPSGWHVPNNNDWNILIDYLGGEGVAASKLKETGVTHWLSPNTGATNESGFTGLPAGKRAGDLGGFWFLHNQLNLWSTDELDVSSARSRPIEVNSYGCIWGYDNKKSGLSIRCVKDYN